METSFIYGNSSHTKILLAVETSCDETSAAVFWGKQLCSLVTSTQPVHAAYGGVVPELASRAHLKSVLPIVDGALRKANISLGAVELLACTHGPGLLGALLVGVSFTRGLSLALNVPAIGINHLQAHLMANFLSPPLPSFPWLGLIVSGGHTLLLLATSFTEMHLLGQTTDDAAGEAFDKAAKILGATYPGGAVLDSWAERGEARRFTYPLAQTEKFNFSFSGIKTAFANHVRRALEGENDFIERERYNLAASFRAAVVEMLLQKVEKAMLTYSLPTLLVGGGVAANKLLQQKLKEMAYQNHWQVHIPPLQYCTDNAAMVGITAYYHLSSGLPPTLLGEPFTQATEHALCHTPPLSSPSPPLLPPP